MNNLYLLKNKREPSYSDCIGSVVVANSEEEARDIYPESDCLVWAVLVDGKYGDYIHYDPNTHVIEQTKDYWFVRDPNKNSEDPRDHFWYADKRPDSSKEWQVDCLEVIFIGNTYLPLNTVVLSSNFGS